jgi:hypothetical protein
MASFCANLFFTPLIASGVISPGKSPRFCLIIAAQTMFTTVKKHSFNVAAHVFALRSYFLSIPYFSISNLISFL